MGHIELARWTEILVVAPASAGAIARLALGLSADLLGAVALATTSPVLLAPAMETHMWAHPATQGHVKTLTARGATVVGPESGYLASGARGTGRMVEPAEIHQSIVALLRASQSLKGKKVLVTAGPTYEPIDPVRFIGNRSSGKMGYAIAEVARNRGAEVTLVSGPTALPPPHAVRFIPVETAAQMRDSALSVALTADVIVMAAAVADFRPSNAASAKIKRAEGLVLDLSPTEDIAAELVRVAPHAFHVGFALETGDLVSAARSKLRRKGQQLVVANEVSDRHNPFGADTNRVVLVSEKDATELPQMSKRDVAAAALDRVEGALR
jgi:phosphopantothenoylcysteine decarboxylase/phosphopantothenate--cysteine ligase